MAPIADANQVPQISPTSTNPRVTKDGDKTRPYVFRVCFIDPFQGTVMAKFARENLKLKRVAILRDVGSDYSVGLADFFKKKFEELGGTIVNDQSFKAGDQDFKAQLTTIKGKTPEMIYVPGYYTEVALMARQARELGIKVPLGGGDGWDSAKLYEIAQGALDGSYFSNHYTDENPDPLIQDFVKRYSEKFGGPPTRWPRSATTPPTWPSTPWRAPPTSPARRCATPSPPPGLPGRGRDHHHRRRPQRGEVGGGAGHREEQGQVHRRRQSVGCGPGRGTDDQLLHALSVTVPLTGRSTSRKVNGSPSISVPISVAVTVTPAAVVSVRLPALGASLTAVTVTVVVAVEDAGPSEAVNPKLSVPLKFGAGRYANVPFVASVMVTLPLVGCVAIEYVTGSRSTSVDASVPWIARSSAPVTAPARAVGASLTGAMVIVTVAGADDSAPSLARKVNVSVPFALRFGV